MLKILPLVALAETTSLIGNLCSSVRQKRDQSDGVAIEVNNLENTSVYDSYKRYRLYLNHCNYNTARFLEGVASSPTVEVSVISLTTREDAVAFFLPDFYHYLIFNAQHYYCLASFHF